MKKVLGMATALIAVFAFAAGVGAQEYDNVADIVDGVGCVNCTKSTVGNVPLPGTSTVTGIQGATTTITTAVCPFDYDDMDPASEFNGVDEEGNRWGYCPNTAVGAQGAEYDAAGEPIPQRNVKFIVNVCECPDSCDLNTGTKIGIQMAILTNGVYWAEDPKAYEDKNGGGYRTIWFKNYPYNPRQTACNAGPEDLTKNFGTVNYYPDFREDTRDGKEAGEVNMIRIPTGAAGSPLAGCSSNPVPSANRMRLIESEIDTDYTVTAADASTSLAPCWFWIDIPAMRVDGTATRGDAIQIRVSLLWQRNRGGLCEVCDPPISCECVRTVAYIGCDEFANDKGCLFFPYLVQGTEDVDGWVAGVGISAVGRDSLPADAWVELTLKDTAGNVATWKNENMENQLVWAFVLDRIMDNFAATLVPGVVSLEVSSNYRIDGYGFLMNQQWQLGSGQLPRTAGGFTCSQ